MGKVGIIATIGPVSANLEVLKSLYSAGMTVARLNGSHSDLDWHRETIALIRKCVPDVPILLDIPGRKIRTTQLAHEPSFKADDIIILTTDISYDGWEKVPVNFERLHEELRPDLRLYADDGTLSFLVERIEGRDIFVRALGAGTLRSRKGINVPEVSLGQDLVTDRDRAMIGFAKQNGVDYVGISFVESAAHVEAIRTLIGEAAPRIVAKIENQGGLDHLEEVVAAADVIMIDRGDLSVETHIDNVSLFQKRIIRVAKTYGKPVIVATELLHTMIENPLPTKAEIGDITNAVIDGAGLLMLSGETAVGKFPVQAVARLNSISVAAQAHLKENIAPASTNEIIQAVRALSATLPVTKVVVLSRTGYAAGLVAAAAIEQPIIAVHTDANFVRSLNLIPGVQGIHIQNLTWDSSFTSTQVLRELLTRGLVEQADMVLAVSADRGSERPCVNSFETFRVGSLEVDVAA